MPRFHQRLVAMLAVAGAFLLAPAAHAAVNNPFAEPALTTMELDAVHGTGLTRGTVVGMAGEQFEAFDRQTRQIMGTTFDNWTFDVALPLIAANIGR